jgi:hypothetical protein
MQIYCNSHHFDGELSGVAIFEVKQPAEQLTGCAVFLEKAAGSTIVKKQIVVRFPPHHFGNQHDGI